MLLARFSAREMVRRDRQVGIAPVCEPAHTFVSAVCLIFFLPIAPTVGRSSPRISLGPWGWGALSLLRCAPWRFKAAWPDRTVSHI